MSLRRRTGDARRGLAYEAARLARRGAARGDGRRRRARRDRRHQVAVRQDRDGARFRLRREGLPDVAACRVSRRSAIRRICAIVYAVARQESEFLRRAASGAGAKGLMQILPSTAAETARRAGVAFDRARLVADPAYNTQLGAAFLGRLIEDEGGSVVLAFAAYNAGARPGRAMDRRLRRSARTAAPIRRLGRAHPLRRDARLRPAGQREPGRLPRALRRRSAARPAVGEDGAGVGGGRVTWPDGEAARPLPLGAARGRPYRARHGLSFRSRRRHPSRLAAALASRCATPNSPN